MNAAWIKDLLGLGAPLIGNFADDGKLHVSSGDCASHSLQKILSQLFGLPGAGQFLSHLFLWVDGLTANSISLRRHAGELSKLFAEVAVTIKATLKSNVHNGVIRLF